MATKQYAYNTRKKPHEQLERELVGSDRWDILNGILKEISIGQNERPKQHWMIIGPRGIGKSHLLTLLYYKVKNEPSLSEQWLTVLFPEELRMANDLSKFLERAVNELFLELEGHPIANVLKQEIDKTRKLPLEGRSSHLFNVLNWIHRESGKRILLLMENLQQLLGKKITVIDQKKLRAFLQKYDSVLIVGSATTIFEALHDHKHPFYHFFHIRRLEDLKFEDMKKLIISILSEGDGNAVSQKVMENEARLRAVYSFTGGNPRMAVFLSNILKTDLPEEMLDFMDGVLEELNPYFEAVLNDTPDYMEEIMNTLAIYEPAQSPKEISAHLEVPQDTTRNYVKQMKEAGYVRVAFSKGKSNYYCLNEYLYRIWYQMRDSGHREETRWIMELLMMLYSPSILAAEKERLAQCEFDEASKTYNQLIIKTTDFMNNHPEYCKVIEQFVETISEKTGAVIDPRIKALFKKAKELEQLKKYEEAIELYKKAVEVDPELSIAYLLWGQSLRRLGRYEDAIEKYTLALNVDTEFASAYWGWGACLRELERYDEAIDKFQKTTVIDPKDAAAYGAWGDCLRSKGQYSKAEEQYKKAIEADSQYDDAYRNWGRCLYMQNKYEEAIEKYKLALKIDPNSSGAYWGWGACLRELKRYDEAIDKFERLVTIDPQAAAYGAWGDCLRHKNLYDEAIEKYKKAIEVDSQYEDAYRVWGHTLYLQGKHEEAFKKYQEALQISPGSEVVYGSWGDSLNQIGRYDEALDKVEKLLKINPNSKNGFGLYVDILTHAKRYADVVATITEKGAAGLDDCKIILNLGISLLEQEKYTDAIEQFDRLIAKHYDCGKVYKLRGAVLEKLNDKENALFSYLTFIAQKSEDGVNLDFQNQVQALMHPILQTLKPETYVKQLFSTEGVKFSKAQLGSLLILLDNYDAVSSHFPEIEAAYSDKKEPERFDFVVFVFAMQLGIWLKLVEDKPYDALRLVTLYADYIRSIKASTDKEKEEEVSKLMLGLFRLQIHKNVKSEHIHKIIDSLSKADIPFSDLFIKIWTCLSEPESVDAQRYLSDKAIAELIAQLKKKDKILTLSCSPQI